MRISEVRRRDSHRASNEDEAKTIETKPQTRK